MMIIVTAPINFFDDNDLLQNQILKDILLQNVVAVANYFNNDLPNTLHLKKSVTNHRNIIC